MNIQQIRNATLKIQYGGKTFLVDPWLAPRWSMGAFADIPGHPFSLKDQAKEQIPMPRYGLPLPAEDILAGVDCYLVTHIHPDHIDMAPDGTVGAPLDKSVPVFVQNTEDAEAFKRSGFRHVEVLKENGFGEAHLTKTPARHGVIKPCGDACGVVLQCAGEKTLYIAGDTVWYDGVEKTLASQKPDIVILNACAAELEGYGRLIMGDEDVEAVSVTAPDAQIVLTHMDNVAHASITRHEMMAKLYRRGVKNYLMPQDGESLML